jgi:hypothetical protein
MASDVLNPTPSEGRLSRYKSVRKAQSSESQNLASTPPPVPPIPPTIPENGEGNQVKRSLSRYHRSASVSQSTQPALPSRTRSERPRREPVPELPKQVIPREQTFERKRSNTVGVQQHPPPSSRGNGSGNSSSRAPKRPTTSSRNQEYGRPRVETARLTEAQQIQASEQARYDRIKAQQRAEREAKHKAAEYERLAREKEQEEKDRVIREVEEAEQRKLNEIAREERRVKEEAEAKRKAEREDAERRKKLRRLKKEDISRPRPADIRAPTREEYNTAPSLGTPDDTTTPTSIPISAKKLGGFFKRRHHESPSPPKSAPGVRPTTSHASPPKMKELKLGGKRSAAPEIPMIKPGGKGIVPLTDAPVSASNHGDRRVRVECGKTTITLPFTPTTSALHLIRSAATVMSEPINPRASVMYEIFSKAGVQRPLRMYEHVRDVVNSWDIDTQHSLLIVPSEIGQDNELFHAFAPKERPEMQSWWLYYSPKPNKWDKRWVTMREDGQVSMAKNEAGKDSINICHLSDFEMYTPTLEHKKKVIRPPKKYCYSVKSQQKSSMFEELTNFIHFFCSNDKQAADSFFSAIQNWRSWYLVNVMGEGQASKGEQKAVVETKTGPVKDKSDEPQAARNPNRDSYYALGTFNTLDLDFTSFAKEPERMHLRRKSHSFSEDRPLATLGLTLPSAQEHSRNQQTRQPSVRQREKNHPPVAYRGMHDSGQSTHRQKPSWNSQNSGEGTFNRNGLLGNQYEERQQNLAPENGGLNRSTSQRSSRTMHRRNSIDGGSIRGGHGIKPKPLIDLTPTYKEPPQHFRKGKGFKPDHIPQGGLVDAIPDNIEVPYALPSQNEWRARPSTSSANQSGMQRQATVSGGHHRTKSLKAHGVKRDDSEEREAFTGSGLLAKGGSGWGHGDKGHGVLSGNQAKGPMIDLREKSQFADGSLLRKVEREGGGNGVS